MVFKVAELYRKVVELLNALLSNETWKSELDADIVIVPGAPVRCVPLRVKLIDAEVVPILVAVKLVETGDIVSAGACPHPTLQNPTIKKVNNKYIMGSLLPLGVHTIISILVGFLTGFFFANGFTA